LANPIFEISTSGGIWKSIKPPELWSSASIISKVNIALVYVSSVLRVIFYEKKGVGSIVN